MPDIATLELLRQQAQAQLNYLRATAKLSGSVEQMARQITSARTQRDRTVRELRAAQAGTSAQAARRATRDYAHEREVRKVRKQKLASGEVLPRPLTSPEYNKIQTYKRAYQFITEDFRNLPNNRATYNLIKRTGDSISNGVKPTKKLQRDYEAYTGQPFPWDSWRMAYIATKIVPWNPPNGFEDDEAA